MTKEKKKKTFSKVYGFMNTHMHFEHCIFTSSNGTHGTFRGRVIIEYLPLTRDVPIRIYVNIFQHPKLDPFVLEKEKQERDAKTPKEEKIE